MSFQAGEVLWARLAPARVPAGHLERPVLRDQILGGFRGRLTTLVAGPGYGKTTMLALALEQAESPWVWCSCDARMGTAQTVVVHLMAALSARFPGFGAGMALRGSPEALVAALSNEIVQTVPDELLIVLDDVHALPPGSPVALTGLLLRDLPGTVHLALAGRSELPLRLGRLRPAGEVVELGEESLALTVEEGEELLRRAGLELDPEEVRDLHRRTEGWAAGLLLGARSGAARSNGGTARRGSGLFDYLAEEVYDRQPEAVRRFLLATCVLDRFTPALAEELGGADAHRIIEGLVAEHLFVVRLQGEDEWYRYHQLFQAFLVRRLQEHGPEPYRRLHARAGVAWRERGEPAEAVRHFIEAGEHDAALDTLEPLVEGMGPRQAGDTLAGWLAAIPRERWGRRPELAAAAALIGVRRGGGEPDFVALDRAIEGLVAAGCQRSAARYCFDFLSTYAAIGRARNDWVVPAVGGHLDRLDPATPQLPAARILLAALHGRAGRHAAAERELAALGRLPGSDEPGMAAYVEISRLHWIDHRRAPTPARLEDLGRWIAELEGDEARDPQAYLTYAYGFRALMLIDLGRLEDALPDLDRADREIARRGLGGPVASLVGFRRTRALVGLGRWDLLAAELERLRPLAEARPARRRRYIYDAGRAALAAARADPAGCSAALERMREGLADDLDHYAAAQLRCDLAPALASVGLAGAARLEVAEAQREAAVVRAPLARARADLLAAALAADPAEAAAPLGAALATTDEHGLDELWTRRERTRAGPLLGRALADGVGPPGVAGRLLAACGGDVLATAAALLATAAPGAREALAAAVDRADDVPTEVLEAFANDPDEGVRRAVRWAHARWRAQPRPPLRLVTLGGFSVLRGNTDLARSALGRPRVRTLMSVLLSADGPLHRDLLLEWLWPTLPPQRGLRSLHTTVFELRRALEPEDRDSGGGLVRTEGESYRLVLARDDEWDAESFLELAGDNGRDGDAEIARLRAAEAAYTGEFLPECRYAAWAATRRAQIAAAYEDVLERLAEALVAAGQPGAAVERYRRLLAREPEAERWHRGLMRAHVAAGDRALALRQFHRCRALIRQRLGSEPSPETRALFASLL